MGERRDGEGLDATAASRARGRRGEELAVAWLRERGYAILARNLRRRQAGEVDLLARRDGVLHIVEVKCGRGPRERLLERVDERKLRLLLRTLAEAGWLDGSGPAGGGGAGPCQVDLLLVILGEQGPVLELVGDLCPPELRWSGGPDV